MQHFIITPFYVRRHFTGKTGKIEVQLAEPDWLEHRLKLFEDYCLVSVTHQSDQNFKWFIYFDDSTPPYYLDRIGSLTKNHRNIFIKTCAFWKTPTLIEDIVAALAADTKWIITTRLDNDDGIHRDFVSMIHSAAQERTEFLNFPRGIILYSGKCYLYEHPSNAFLSLVEPVEQPKTAWCIAHNQARQIAPVRQLTDTPAFLQVVHGKNVSNKPRGTRIFARRARAGFEAIPHLSQLGDKETWLGVVSDNVTTVLLWRLRDFVVSLIKAIIR
jgi:Putative rhamnosyl transferase